jgi:predicted secreted hydrolase
MAAHIIGKALWGRTRWGRNLWILNIACLENEGIYILRRTIVLSTVALSVCSTIAAIAFGASIASGELALPGYRYRFPADYFSHSSYQTEWWYYTGNLKTREGQEFGFELTFFRFHPDERDNADLNSVWSTSQIYIAHFALTDMSHKRFYVEERVNRSGPGLAGVDGNRGEVWNGNWSARWLSYEPVRQRIEAVTGNAHLRLELTSQKPVVIHGENGVSRKGPEPGEASHYYSLTRLAVSGSLSFEGHTFQTTGQAWMDREFFSTVKNDPVAGWDWMCIQLSTDEEIMLYRLRLKDGSLSPYSSATFVGAGGKSEFLDSRKFSLEPMKKWHSSVTQGDYPVEWKIGLPSKQISLHLTTTVQDQELVTGITRSYWEGAVRYAGTEAGVPVTGVGYLEMTGYAKPRHGAAKAPPSTIN